MARITKEQLIEENNRLRERLWELRTELWDVKQERDALLDSRRRNEKDIRRLENTVHYLAGMLMDKWVVLQTYDYWLDVRINVEVSKEEEERYKTLSEEWGSSFTYCNSR